MWSIGKFQECFNNNKHASKFRVLTLNSASKKEKLCKKTVLNLNYTFLKKRIMKVLMFGWEFPPNISGGLGTACYGIVNGMFVFDDLQLSFVIPCASQNINNKKFSLISADKIEIDKRQLPHNENNTEFIRIESKLTPYLYPLPEEFTQTTTNSDFSEEKGESSTKTISFSGKYGQGLFSEIYNYSIVAKTIASEYEHDIIHAHDWLTFPAALAAKNTSGKPLVLHIHSTDFDRSGGSVNEQIYGIEKTGMENADHIITVSNLIRDRLINQYGIDSKKISTIYNAILPKQENSNSKISSAILPKTVTFLGRITIQKGPAYFIELAKQVLKQTKNVRFVMAGNGDLMEEMIELVAAVGISDKFLFAGFLVGNEVDELLSKTDVFVMPSVSEPFGIVPLEAMQANVPVIISKQSGVAEMIHSAVKTDFWDVNAMADAVIGILKYKALSKTLIDDANEELKTINWKNTASEIRNVYINLLNKK